MNVQEILKNHIAPIPDGPSSKDWLFSSLSPNLKKLELKEKILPEVTSVSNQRYLPSCTSNATCDAFEYVFADKVDLSRLFVYWNSRLDKTQLTGTSLRSALDSLRIFGVPSESTWPYDLDKVNTQPSPDAFKEALKRRETTYYRVDTKNISEIVASIDTGWPVVISVQLDKMFETDPIASDHVFDGRELSSSFHAMIIVGYRRLDDGSYQFRVRNSWGSQWCDQGYCWFTSEYVQKCVTDAWAITNYIPNESVLSRRNVEFAATTVASILLAWMMWIALKSGQQTKSAVIGGFVCAALLEVFGIWRRWWLNITINDKLKFNQ